MHTDDERIREIVREELVAQSSGERSWTRRSVLAAVAGAAGISALGGRARAATPDGYLGSGDDPLGIYLADAQSPDSGDMTISDSDGTTELRRDESAGEWNFESSDVSGVGSLRTNDGFIDPAGVEHTGELADIDDVGSGGNTASDDGRDLYTTSSISVSVDSSGEDYSSIQAAIDDIPFLLYDAVEINVASGFDASTEDLLIDQTAAGTETTSYGGFEHKVTITGDTTTPSNNPLGSIVVSGLSGGFYTLRGFDLQQDNPYKNDGSDSDAPVAVMHSDSFALHDCTYSGGTTGLLAYGESGVDVNGVDFGSSVLTDYAVFAKHGAFIQMQRVGDVTGTAGSYAYRADAGIIQTVASHSLDGSNGKVDPDSRGGPVFEEVDAAGGWVTRFIGPGYDFDVLAINDNQLYVQGSQPSNPDTGDIWIDNS
jgi:hypothetical protein